MSQINHFNKILLRIARHVEQEHNHSFDNFDLDGDDDHFHHNSQQTMLDDPVNISNYSSISNSTIINAHNDHDTDHDITAVNIAKATAMVVLFCASTLCGSIPFILNRWFKWTENNTNARSAIVVKCLLYFGGGVLLSTTFLHLLPEVTENIESLQSDHKLPELKFHLPELLMCLGFFAMFFVEEIIHAYIHRHQKNLDHDSASMAFERGRSVRDSFLVKGRRKSSLNNLNDSVVNSNNNTNNNNNTSNNSSSNNGITMSIKDANLTSSKTSGLSIQDLIKNDVESQKYEAQQQESAGAKTGMEGGMDAHGHHHHHMHHHHLHHQHSHDQHHQQQPQQQQQHHHHHHHHHHAHSHLPKANVNEDMIVSSLRGLLIVLALSVHELFEGLAVGLEGSAANVWYMFGAVSAHKLVLAFCVGVELIVTRTRLWLSIVYVVTFAIVSPIGIGIGILVSNEKSAASAIPSAILQGLATGTLLYVVFFEILSKEKSGLIAYLAFIIGFFFMFGLQFATGHEHTHSHGGNGGHGHSHGDDAHTHHSHSIDHLDHDDHEFLNDNIEHTTKSTEEQLKLLREAADQFTTALVKTFNK